MDQSLEVSNVRNEPTESTSSHQMEIPAEVQPNSVKRESDCLVKSEIHPKMEPQEDQNEFPVIANSFFDMCSSYDMKIETEEPMIKIECEGMPDELMQDPLDVGSKIKDTSYEIYPSDYVKVQIDEPMIKFESGNLIDATTQVGSETKVAIENEELLRSESDDDVRYSTKETDEGENDKCNLSSDDEESSDTESRKQNQLLGRKKRVDKNKKYTCHICHYIFKHKGNLNVHLRIHRGAKPYSCDICGKLFSQKGNLETHMLIHNKEKPYSCNVCQKVFNQKSNLNMHKLIHSGVKPFSCKECGKSFIHKQDLVRHQRIHTGDKPFACDLCDKAFTQKTSLTKHIRLHTGEKPYSCEICKKSFAQKAGLNYHIRTHKQ